MKHVRNVDSANILLFCSHQEPRWPEDHFDRDKRQAEWDFSKEFFCDVPGKILNTERENTEITPIQHRPGEDEEKQTALWHKSLSQNQTRINLRHRFDIFTATWYLSFRW